MVKDHATEKIAKHHFSIPKCVNEDGISDLLNKFYAADFMENQTLPSNGINEKLNEVSAGDIKFLKLMDEGRTRCNGNYQLPLPFRNSEVDLPNNRWLPERRLQYLKKKLQQDELPSWMISSTKDMPQNQLVYKHQVFGILLIMVYTNVTNQKRYRWYLTVTVSFKGGV